VGCKVSFFAVVASTLSLQSLATNYDALGYPDENGNFVLTEEGRKFWGRFVPGSILICSRMEAGMETCPRSVTFVTKVFMSNVIHHVCYHVNGGGKWFVISE
jgi:hypothetical protein